MFIVSLEHGDAVSVNDRSLLEIRDTDELARTV